MSASIEASLRLEIAQYQEALAKARGEAKKFKDQLKQEGSGLGKNLFGSLKNEFAGLMPAFGAAAAVQGMHSLISAADDLADAATKLDTTPATFQRVQAAAEILGGTDMDTVTSALVRLRRQLIEDPGSALARGLRQVGIETEAFLRLDADEQIAQLADAFAKAQQDGVALPLLNEAFGKSFKELIPLLSQGGDGIREFYSGVITASDGAVARLAAANDRIDVFTKSVKNWATEAIGAVIGLGQALATAGSSMEEEQAQIDEANMKAMRAREAQAEEALNKQAAAEAKGVTKGAGLDVDRTKEHNDAIAKAITDTEKAQAKLDAAKRRMEEDQMTREEKIAAIKERIAQIDAEPVDPFAAESAASQIEKETRKVELQTELNRLLQEQRDLVRQATEDIDAESKAENEKAISRENALASLREEILLMQARARHDDDAVARMERELEIRKRTKQIMDQTGLDEQRARMAATSLVDLADQAEGGGKNKDGKKPMRRRMMGGHLSDYENLQNSPFGSGSLARGSGPLADRAKVAAGKQDARDKQDTSGLDLGSKILAVLQTLAQ